MFIEENTPSATKEKSSNVRRPGESTLTPTLDRLVVASALAGLNKFREQNYERFEALKENPPEFDLF